MKTSALRARMERMDELCEGLLLEMQRWKYPGGPPVFTKERRSYDDALMKAIRGLGEARAVLANIVRRLEDEASRRR
jgi:hypothetical protein